MRTTLASIVLLVALASRHAAQQESDSASGQGGTDLQRGSPQYIYMQRLHSKLMATTGRVTATLEASDGGGTLLATSFESSGITGMNDNGFPIQISNILSMDFTIPNQGDVSNIQKAELWIFPDDTSPLAQATGPVTFPILATASFHQSKRPRTDTFVVTWRPEDGCIPIDLTDLTVKIARKISMLTEEEVNVRITLEVLDTLFVQQRTLPSKGGCVDHPEDCIALQDRTTNTPFLVVKYFTYDGDSEPESAQEQKREARSKRGFFPVSKHSNHRREENGLQESSSSKADDSGCKLRNLTVNLTEIYGSFVVAPLYANIRDCAGPCRSSDNERHSTHAIVKERMNYFSGSPRLSVCCSPATYKPLEFLIHQEGNLLIVEFPDLVATSCSCR